VEKGGIRREGKKSAETLLVSQKNNISTDLINISLK
jgi:hypothetical protein